MKILLLCWRDTHHPQGGGSERYLERVGDFLVSQGHEVLFHTAMYPGAPRRSMQRGVAYTRAGGKMTVYPLAWLRLVAARLGFGRLRDVDVVVDTQNGIPFFAGPLSGKPTVLVSGTVGRAVVVPKSALCDGVTAQRDRVDAAGCGCESH